MDGELLGCPGGSDLTSIFEKTEELPVSVLETNEMKSLRIATLNVLTLGPAEEREANVLRVPARQARLASTFEEAGVEIIGLQECRLPAQVVVREGFVMVTSEAEEGSVTDC